MTSPAPDMGHLVCRSGAFGSQRLTLKPREEWKMLLTHLQK